MTTFSNVKRTAAKLGLPVSFLRAEAEARRIPALRVGRRLYLNPADVEQALADRVKPTTETGATR